MTSACLSTAYFAPVSYYKALCNHDYVIIEKCCHYVKQTYRNRCNIVSANGVIPLSVPIIKPDTPKCFTRDIRISDHDNWQHMHWNAILSAYGSSPFFEYYQDDLYPFFKKNLAGTFLFDFNESLRKTICRLLEITPNVIYSKEYIHYDGTGTEDLREVIHPKKEPNGTIRLQPYYQVFSSKLGFIPDASILDLLFNMGPEAQLVLYDRI